MPGAPGLRRSGHRLRIAAVLVAIFALSVLLRLPLWDKPGLLFEMLNYQTLVPVQIWTEESPARYHFAPIFSFQRDADKFIANRSGITDALGNHYYVSYPPFTYLLPFIVARLVHVHPDVGLLKSLGLLLHFVTAFFVYRIITLLCGRDARGLQRTDRSATVAACLGFAAYVLTPIALFFHQNVFTAEVLIQPFYVMAVYVVLRLDGMENRRARRPLLILAGGLVFLMAYTELLGLWFALAVALLVLRRDRRLALAVGLGAALALALTLAQYAAIDGPERLVSTALGRFMQRSGYLDTVGGKEYGILSPRGYYLIAGGYHREYRHLGYAMVVYLVAIIAVVPAAWEVRRWVDRRLLVCAYLVILPVVIHHALLFEGTAIHRFTLLKSLVFLSVLLGVLHDRVAWYFRERPRRIGALTLVVCLILLVEPVNAYLGSIPYGDVRIPEGDADAVARLGRAIGDTAAGDEVVFVRSAVIGCSTLADPPIMFHARRNVACGNAKDAAAHLRRFGRKKAVIFTVDEKFRIKSVERISPSE